jgi:hypothetical protein
MKVIMKTEASSMNRNEIIVLSVKICTLNLMF